MDRPKFYLMTYNSLSKIAQFLFVEHKRQEDRVVFSAQVDTLEKAQELEERLNG